MLRSTSFRRLLTSSLLALALSGCNTNFFQRRTVYVAPGEPMRIREPIHNVKVWIFVDGKWEPSEAATLPEGAYIVYKRPVVSEE